MTASALGDGPYGFSFRRDLERPRDPELALQLLERLAGLVDVEGFDVRRDKGVRHGGPNLQRRLRGWNAGGARSGL